MAIGADGYSLLTSWVDGPDGVKVSCCGFPAKSAGLAAKHNFNTEVGLATGPVKLQSELDEVAFMDYVEDRLKKIQTSSAMAEVASKGFEAAHQKAVETLTAYIPPQLHLTYGLSKQDAYKLAKIVRITVFQLPECLFNHYVCDICAHFPYRIF